MEGGREEINRAARVSTACLACLSASVWLVFARPATLFAVRGCLPQENERLLDLLGHMDSERARLARERQELLGELVCLRATAPDPDPGPSSAGDSAGSGDGSSTSQQQQQQQQRVEELERRRRQLEAELQAERQRRQQAELDFQELLTNMDLLHGSPSPPSTAGSPPPAAACAGGSAGSGSGLAGQQQQQMRPQAAQLQAAVSSLQHIAQGLSSISGEGSERLGLGLRC